MTNTLSAHARRLVARLALASVLVGAGSVPPHAQTAAQSAASRALETNFIARVTGGSLFENVVAVLGRYYYDAEFRQSSLPALVQQYRPRAAAAATVTEQRQVTFDLLSHVPASHLGLLSVATHLSMMRDLETVSYPMLGFQIVDVAGGSYATWVLEDGPAARAGLLSWDRIVSIDGTAVAASPLVEWRSDDAFMPDALDPAMHIVTPTSGTVRLRVERRAGEFRDVVVTAATYSVFAAEAASVKVLDRGGRRIGYVHLWNVPLSGVPDLLKRALTKTLDNCDAVIIDLRGRGGSATEVPKIVDALKDDRSRRHRPIVALVDRQSRSAKDVLAYEFKTQHIATLVGEPTAGAVVPAGFAEVGYDTVLMLPVARLPKYTDLLERKPVLPDVSIERAGPFSAGQDPILDAGIAEAIRQSGERKRHLQW